MVSLKFELEKVEDYGWMNLEEEEEIQFRTHPSIIPKLPEILGALLMSFAAIAGAYYFWETLTSGPWWYMLIPVILFFVGVGDALWTYYQIKATFFVFTDDKFVRKTNIVRTTVRETPYNKVQHFDLNFSSIPERFLNIGTISIATAGTGGTELVLRDVPNPEAANEVLSDYT